MDTHVVVKPNVAEVLRPGIIGALTDSGTPFSILTRGALLRRDLPQPSDAARRVDVSVAVGDGQLHGRLEPGTPTPARPGLISAIREAGSRFTAPVPGAGPVNAAAELQPTLF